MVENTPHYVTDWIEILSRTDHKLGMGQTFLGLRKGCESGVTDHPGGKWTASLSDL